MTNQTSPFAPIDIPDLNDVATPSAMPPMGVPDSVPSATAQPVQPVQTSQPTQPAQSASQTMQIPTPQVSQAQPVNKTEPVKPVPVGTQSAPVNKPVGTANKPTEAVKVAEKPKATGASKPVETSKPIETPRPDAVPKPDAMSKPAVKDVEVATPSAVKAEGRDLGITVEPLLEECIRQRASDLHLQVGLPPILRVDGVLRPMTTFPLLDNEMVQQLVFSTLDEDQQKILLKDKEFDYSFAFGDMGRFRVNAFHEKGNMAGAFRLIPNEILSIQELGLPGVVEDFANRPNGLVLITGPTGSGKSTTLAALIDKVNAERAVHIITIEDPIEFTHKSKRALVAQREVHYDTFSFSAALRSILREDPDVVLIGEMRDLETIRAAITVAETGHLVFATLHTNSAAQSIDRMVDVFPAHQQPQIRAQLANILVGICSQRLIPSIDGGRVAVAEVLVANSAVRAIIREGKTHQLDMTIQTGADQGMQTMDRELAKYVKAGIISYDIAREYAVDVAEFDRLARG